MTRSDVLPPADVAARICEWSQAKVDLSLRRLVVLGLLGGLYIGFGAALFTIVISDNGLGFGLNRWLGGASFSLGLVLVVIGGAELSTGNCLMTLARMRGSVRARDIWRNWATSFAANAVGAMLLAGCVFWSGTYDAEPVRRTVIAIAEGKLGLSYQQAFLKGMLCNILVCLAVWLAAASSTFIGKVTGIVFPISAFVALGFEHSIANCFLLPLGVMLGAHGSAADCVANLVPVTLGNLVGGAVVVAGLLANAFPAPPCRR